MTPVARNQGTTIDVRDIFFNAPVRKKFLSSEKSEYQAIDLIVKRFALGSPAITINLSHNGKLQRHLPGALAEHSRLMRMTKLLGKSFVDTSIYLDAEHAGIRLYGWVSGPDFQRSQNDKLWVYINGRMVKDKLINHAIKQAYEGLLYPGRNPACLLYLTINPALVDVNVHPTKHEVRFQQPRLIHDLISSQLRDVLKGSTFSVVSSIVNLANGSGLQVRESSTPPLYTAQKVRTERIGSSLGSDNKHWIALNPSFAIVFLHREPYLVDVVCLQRQWLLERLKKASLPLASRPLLVPIHMQTSLISPDALLLDIQSLQRVGIDVAWVSDTKLAIHSLPILTPNLDIKLFLTSCFTGVTLSTTHLFELLVNHETVGAETINVEQQAEYCAYLEAVPCAFARQLSLKICQDILNVG